MPIYQNTSDESKFFPEYGNVAAGAYITSQTYPYPLDSAFVLTEYGDAPWVKLHAGVLPATLTSLAKYAQLLVVNDTGDLVTMAANEDATNTMVVLDSQTRTVEQDHEIEKLSITGSGGSNLYVYGLE